MKSFSVIMVVVLLLLTSNVFAATLTAVQAGSWDSDIWATSLVNPAMPGLRPAAGDDVQINVTASGIMEVDVETPDLVTYRGYFGKMDVNNAPYELTFTNNFLVAMNDKKADVYVRDGATLNVGNLFKVTAGSGDPDTRGRVYQYGGTVNSTGAMWLTNAANETGLYSLRGGELNISSNLNNAGGGNGTFEWTGGALNCPVIKIDIDNQGGSLNPGGSGVVGTTTFDVASDYTQDVNSSIWIDIAGDSDYDQLLFNMDNSTVIIEGGTIDIDLIGLYVPASGTKFDIIKAERIFVEPITDVNGVDITGDSNDLFAYQVVDDPESYGQILQLVYDDYICPVTVPGDVDGDCVIDLADLAALAGRWLDCDRYPSSFCP